METILGNWKLIVESNKEATIYNDNDDDDYKNNKRKQNVMVILVPKILSLGLVKHFLYSKG